MSTEEKIRTARKRYRSYRVWNLVRTTVRYLWALSAVATVAILVLGMVFIFTSDGIPDYLAVLSPLTAFMTIGCLMAAATADRKVRVKIFPLIDNRTFFSMRDHLLALGITDSIEYLFGHQKNVSAYLSFKRFLCSEIEVPNGTFTGDETSHERDLIIQREEDKVALLLLPGDRELAREEQIRQIIQTRSIRKYADIKEIVENTVGQPQALTDGVL